MARKKKFNPEFDFDAYAEKLLEQAELCGVAEDGKFKTIFLEWCRMKVVCDKLFKEISEGDVLETATNKKGVSTVKANPCIKDYTNAHKTLVATTTSLQKYMDGVKPKELDDDYAL